MEDTGSLRDTGDGFWVRQAEDVINDLERGRFEGTGHARGSTGTATIPSIVITDCANGSDETHLTVPEPLDDAHSKYSP